MSEAQALHALQDNDTIENILPLVKKQVVEEAPKFTSEEILDALGKNEDGDAAIYIKLNRGRFVYDAASGRWYKWNDHWWEQDFVNEALESLSQVAGIYGAESLRQGKLSLNAATEDESKIHRKIMKDLMIRAQTLRTISRKENVLKLARAGASSLAIRGDAWDREPWLFGVANGVIDLRTGKLRPGKPDDYIKVFSPVEYKGFNEKAPAWDHFLKGIFDGNGEIISFMGRLLGYCMTGHTTEHIAPILSGSGRNGKTTLIETVAGVFGKYAGQVESEMLLSHKFGKQSGGPSADIMALQGRRFVYCSETEEGRRFNVAKLKWLSGGDTLVGRVPHGKEMVTFKGTHKIFLSTNHRPHADAEDFAFWKRVVLIPFNIAFVKDPQKKHERQADTWLPEKLEKEGPGILAWLVRGCLEWQRDGLKIPQVVQMATDKYRDEENIIKQFAQERCILGPEKRTQAKTLFDAFRTWCDENGHSINQKQFSREIRKRFAVDDTGRYTFYEGIGLKE